MVGTPRCAMSSDEGVEMAPSRLLPSPSVQVCARDAPKLRYASGKNLAVVPQGGNTGTSIVRSGLLSLLTLEHLPTDIGRY